MDDLIDRIKAEGWHMRLCYNPNLDKFICILMQVEKTTSQMADSPEAAIIDAIREMDR